jgi:hypothetical protein
MTTPSLYEQLEKALLIDEHALDEAIEEQPDCFHKVSKQLAILESRRDAAKQALADEEAKVDTELRMKARKNDEKITNDEIKAQTRLMPSVKKASQTYLELNGQVNLYEALKESFKQRSYALGHLVDLFVAGYFGQLSQTRTSGGMKEQRHMQARTEINRVRREAR